MFHGVFYSVSTWRCKCGAHVKVIGERGENQPLTKADAECPTCGDKHAIYATRILSVTQEADDATHPQTSE
jgi:hypothetical protein